MANYSKNRQQTEFRERTFTLKKNIKLVDRNSFNLTICLLNCLTSSNNNLMGYNIKQIPFLYYDNKHPATNGSISSLLSYLAQCLIIMTNIFRLTTLSVILSKRKFYRSGILCLCCSSCSFFFYE